ncbi:AglZ/HisF2 family acetamidino modification protein [Desulfobacula sp.]|uniref:AglZ/HisF2 family acetamidino modification protein n=1 Tax=Desulfobacula sp. TaxID=2593537 RepID=UPI0025C37988|nr:AglZ/HisF2 family acetamidino modification protein [Desulfobacula sp.]MBC2704240.1 imidazole glycerol phosphate synthase subunit HisF [Desulfobacula sp.]
MSLKRIMPCLLIKEKRLVKTVNFKNPNYIGDPINAVKIYNDKEVDELIVLDIKASKSNTDIDFNLIQDFAAECFMPLAYGGGIRKYEHFKKIFNLGVEKIVINTLLFDNPEIVKKACENFGSQSIVASIDVIKNRDGNYQVFSHSDRTISKNLTDYISYVLSLNVGELIVTSVDNEGTWKGFDYQLLKNINSMTDIPIIANGGCGKNKDLTKILYEIGLQAAAVGSMAVYQKKGMGVLIRFPKRSDIINDE